jgi:hypothetical protein
MVRRIPRITRLAGQRKGMQLMAMLDQHPSREFLEKVADTAHDLAAHIKRYWSLDDSIPQFSMATMMPSIPVVSSGGGKLKRIAEVITAVDAQRNGKHPGPVIEWQLRELVAEWQSLNVGAFAADPNAFVMYLPLQRIAEIEAEALVQALSELGNDAAIDLVQQDLRRFGTKSCDLWREWSAAVPVAVRGIAVAVERIIHPLEKGVVDSFAGCDLAALLNAVQALRDAIAFTPTQIQELILKVLDGASATGPMLMLDLGCGSKETLYGKHGRGGLTELVNLGLVKKLPAKRGYFRPDKPPSQKAY